MDGFFASVIPRSHESADRVREILGLPDDAWSELRVTFGIGEVAKIEVTLIPRPQQLWDLLSLVVPVEIGGSGMPDG